MLSFEPADDVCPWLFRKWVAIMPKCVSSLLTASVLVSLGSEYLLCLGVSSLLTTLSSAL
jgi:hypothetical protein